MTALSAKVDKAAQEWVRELDRHYYGQHSCPYFRERTFGWVCFALIVSPSGYRQSQLPEWLGRSKANKIMANRLARRNSNEQKS